MYRFGGAVVDVLAFAAALPFGGAVVDASSLVGAWADGYLMIAEGF